jgi:hypothetical protein
MLERDESSAQLRKWLDRLVPLAEQARAKLAGTTPEKLLMRTGCDRDGEGRYRLRYFDREYTVSPADFEISRADSGEAPSSFTESLLLTYMATADGTTPSGRWIGFRELPDGMFYVQAFQGYSGGRLVRDLAAAGVDLLHAVRCAGAALGGAPLDIGDCGFAFTVLPRIQMAIACWEGDEEFPCQATVLFEDTAANYLPTDGLAIVGSQLVNRLLSRALQGG